MLYNYFYVYHIEKIITMCLWKQNHWIIVVIDKITIIEFVLQTTVNPILNTADNLVHTLDVYTEKYYEIMVCILLLLC